jgi:hypothetical protein
VFFEVWESLDVVLFFATFAFGVESFSGGMS